MGKIELSNLGHTWILDLDGTLLKHNGYKTDGEDTLLEGAIEFLDKIQKEDMIIILTSREEKYRKITESFLNKHSIRYDTIIFEVPYGERILVNDSKPSGLSMALAINTLRDHICEEIFEVNEQL